MNPTALSEPQGERAGIRSARTRIWIDPPLAGEIQMAIDRTLLERAERSSRPTTWIRLYRWARPTVSLGRHQAVRSAVDLDFCRSRSVPVVRRPTGGRAVFHSEEVTYAVVSNDRRLFPFHSIGLTYLTIARMLRRGLLSFGIDASPFEKNRVGPAESLPAPQAHELKLPCFASTARYELNHAGKKLAGSAQRRLKNSFLQHGSIPMRIDFELMGAALGISHQLLRSKMTCLEDLKPGTVRFSEVAGSLKNSFETMLQEGLVSKGLPNGF